jgi:hypothetical protein
MAESLNKQDENKPLRNEKGQLLPGNTANPNGRPKGQTLKEYWRQRFSNMTDEEKLVFTQKVGNEAIWKMAEGLPKQDIDMEANITGPNIIRLDE